MPKEITSAKCPYGGPETIIYRIDDKGDVWKVLFSVRCSCSGSRGCKIRMGK